MLPAPLFYSSLLIERVVARVQFRSKQYKLSLLPCESFDFASSNYGGDDRWTLTVVNGSGLRYREISSVSCEMERSRNARTEREREREDTGDAI